MSARLGLADGHILAWIGDDAHHRQAAGDIPFVERARFLNGKPAAHPRPAVARMVIEGMGVRSVMRWILALKERRNYNIHETHTGLVNTPGILCDCVPSQ